MRRLKNLIIFLNKKKWLRSIESNFKPIQKMVDDIKDFERAKKLPKTWSGRNKNTFN